MENDVIETALHEARALVLRDLAACGAAEPEFVSLVEDAVSERRWWVKQWPDGAAYAPGLVAQDVQEALEAAGVRWPSCPRHDDTPDAHQLYLEPELGEDPTWVCEKDAAPVAPLGWLSMAEAE
ncbi:hypothetical protein [Yinghuangia seranimata]|uniref:hypothetical protein n=1 Tax=Yinghuangia seranimata TaxID=408067 RepID=UPI00248C7FC3|nr:hypothetical protein [Yinghuangia seranimata]MDI2131222.1 hypothetical protein [Yinghuangia seranimata]